MPFAYGARFFRAAYSTVTDPKVGARTTHFWGPVANWGISLATLYDMKYKSPDVVSTQLTGTLALYSLFFMRFAYLVQPRNWMLIGFHVFNEGVQLTQLARKMRFERLKESQGKQDIFTKNGAKKEVEKGVERGVEKVNEGVDQGKMALAALYAGAIGVSGSKLWGNQNGKSYGPSQFTRDSLKKLKESQFTRAGAAGAASSAAPGTILGIVPKLRESILASVAITSPVHSFLAHPAGPFTIFFWAPTFKWTLSLSNLMEYNRPVDQISTAQQCALMCTGFIWTRWGFVIAPVNYNLAAVNFSLGATSMLQLGRKYVYNPWPSEAGSATTTTSGTQRDSTQEGLSLPLSDNSSDTLGMGRFAEPPCTPRKRAERRTREENNAINASGANGINSSETNATSENNAITFAEENQVTERVTFRGSRNMNDNRKNSQDPSASSCLINTGASPSKNASRNRHTADVQNSESAIVNVSAAGSLAVPVSNPVSSRNSSANSSTKLTTSGAEATGTN